MLEEVFFLYFNYLVSVTAGGPGTSPRAHVATFYGRASLPVDQGPPRTHVATFYGRFRWIRSKHTCEMEPLFKIIDKK